VVVAPAQGQAAACFGSVKRGVGNRGRQAVRVERRWSDQGGWRKTTPWSSAWKNDGEHTGNGFDATATQGRQWQNGGKARLGAELGDGSVANSEESHGARWRKGRH
jgi:hypothetical protein